MADSSEGASDAIGHRATGATTDMHNERGAGVVADFIDAARAVAESLLEKQTRQASARSEGIAEALHSAAHALEASENTVLARYARQAGDKVHEISREVRERRWNEIIADTQDLAQRQPIWFVLGAMAVGFVVGRFIWAPTSGGKESRDPSREVSSGEAACTLSVASAREVGEAEPR